MAPLAALKAHDLAAVPWISITRGVTSGL